MPDWFTSLYDTEGLKQLIVAGGLLLLVGIVFAETGILAGFFLPGDSLLVTAGVLCVVNPLNPADAAPLEFWTVGCLLCGAAVAGDWVNFWFGKLTGNRIWQRPDGRFFKRKYLIEAQEFYARWGGISLAGARFVPIARTFVPFVAGMARMPFGSFMFWNLAGAVTWVWSLLALGYWLGGNEALVKNLHYLILLIVAISFVPLVIGVLRRWLRKAPAEAPATADQTAP